MVYERSMSGLYCFSVSLTHRQIHQPKKQYIYLRANKIKENTISLRQMDFDNPNLSVAFFPQICAKNLKKNSY